MVMRQRLGLHSTQRSDETKRTISTNDLPFSQIFKLCLSLHSGELPSSEVSIIIIHIGRRVDVLRCEAVSEGHVVLPLLPPEAPRRDGHFPWLKEINLRTKCYNWT